MGFEKENCRPGGSISERAGQLSLWEDSELRPAGQGLIEGYLGRGQDAAVTLQQLVNWTGLDGRTVRKQIEAERRRYIPIVSDNIHGYYLAETRAEADAFIRSMRSRVREITATADALERATEGLK